MVTVTVTLVDESLVATTLTISGTGPSVVKVVC